MSKNECFAVLFSLIFALLMTSGCASSPVGYPDSAPKPYVFSDCPMNHLIINGKPEYVRDCDFWNRKGTDDEVEVVIIDERTPSKR